ncbi:hypothetical protein BD626DRAFT_478766 [Schizophyllum amplum]|uniref:Uncharacterized protein n=1 Tax=Schizophyllum amplum TaxID=97359 RepID=A0A550CRK1_9AGAR|nr:hypothetical protein BD626DRAFT_478766 [Auriculariopsis ampla]
MSSETHFPALARATPYLHVGFHDSVCPWQGCTYAIPRNVVDSMLSVVSATGPGQLLEQHVLVEHFKAIPQCPLCQCDLRHPPMLPIQRSTYYVLTTHLASGWCVGLARIARAKGLPVPEPWKPARP